MCCLNNNNSLCYPLVDFKEPYPARVMLEVSKLPLVSKLKFKTYCYKHILGIH